MFYFLHGNFNKVLEKSNQIQKALLKKQPDASVFKINISNFSENQVSEFFESQTLFVNKYIVTVSRILEDAESKLFFIDNLERFASSQNVFLVQEENVDSKILKKIEKFAEKIDFFEVKESKSIKMNLFDLAGAIGKADKKNSWILYRKALLEYSAEEIYGVVWWQIKTLLIASRSKNLAESGLKAFPFQKAKDYLKNFNKKRLDNLAYNLIKIYHESRLYGEDLETAFEKLILTY